MENRQSTENPEIYLNEVERQLAESIAQLSEALVKGEEDVAQMHDYYWSNYTEMDEYGYENFDNSQALLAQINSNNSRLDQKRIYRKMQDSPYFGRVDFAYEGEDEPETHYIGIANFSAKDGGKPLIFDWRAPVSALFYDYEKGPASYDAPFGKVSGEITSKWHYKIKRGKLIYAVESDFKVDDDVLQEELSKNGSLQLKNIVRTIQKEQNAIIRNTQDRILVIQGSAGSGKTSIALHRIAYLLYHDRRNLKAADVLILSPNRVFSNYISQILPELGEENIREMSFDYFAWRELRDWIGDSEDLYDALERKLQQRKPKSGPDKFSEEFAAEIRGYVLMLEDDLVKITDFSTKKVFWKASKIRDLFYHRFPEIPLLARMDTVREYIEDSEETLRGKNLTDPEKQLWKEKFDRMYETKDIYRIYNRFLKAEGLQPLPDVKPEKRKVPYEDLYPMLYMRYLLEGPGKHRSVRHLVIDEMQDYSYLQYLILQQLFHCPMTILGDRCQTMDAGQRDVRTFLPRIFGKDIRFLSIDKSYRNTIEVAEYAQGLIGETGVANFGRHGKPPEHITVDSPEEAAAEVLSRIRLEEIPSEKSNSGEALHPAEKPRTGEKQRPAEEPRTGEEQCSAEVAHPEENASGDRGRLFETAAVICLSEQEAEEMYAALKSRMESDSLQTDGVLTLMNPVSDQFRRGITVTTFYMAKGLEFDQVFVRCPSARKVSGWSSEKQALVRQAAYISATRALHELYLLEEKSGRKAGTKDPYGKSGVEEPDKKSGI